MATKSGPAGPLLVAIIGPPVYFSLQKAVHPSEKWTGCSFRSLARFGGIKSITIIPLRLYCATTESLAIHITNQVRGRVHVTATDSLHYQ